MKYKARKEKKAAQKKYEAPVAYYSGLETDFYFETKSAKTAGWTDEGREYLKQAKPFCECLRTIVSRLINKTDYTKPDLSAKYNLSSRLFNSAEVLAKGEFASLQETKVLALDLSKAKYDLALYHYAQDYVTGMDKDEEKRKIARIGKWRKKIDINEGRQEHPIYRPGYDVYRRQHQMTREDFRKEWDAVRNNRIASIGVWDEPPCCNSELQVHFDDKVEDINKAVSRPYRFKIMGLCS